MEREKELAKLAKLAVASSEARSCYVQDSDLEISFVTLSDYDCDENFRFNLIFQQETGWL
jgi:hypothetical protein